MEKYIFSVNSLLCYSFTRTIFIRSFVSMEGKRGGKGSSSLVELEWVPITQSDLIKERKREWERDRQRERERERETECIWEII
jgi:hypothetical protein